MYVMLFEFICVLLFFCSFSLLFLNKHVLPKYIYICIICIILFPENYYAWMGHYTYNIVTHIYYLSLFYLLIVILV